LFRHFFSFFLLPQKKKPKREIKNEKKKENSKRPRVCFIRAFVSRVRVRVRAHSLYR